MFVLYCPGKLLLGGTGPWTPPPTVGTLGPVAADAPGALNALENANLNTCQKIGRGGGVKLVGALPSVLPHIWGAHPLLQVKFGGSGMSWEQGRGDSPRYPETSPGQGWPPRFHVGCYCCRGRGWGNRYESPPGRFLWHRGDFEAQVELVLPNSLGMPWEQPPGAAAASPPH